MKKSIFLQHSPLSDKVRMFNTQANKHIQSQALNPFSQGNVHSVPKPKFSKEEYGRYVNKLQILKQL